MSWGLGVSDQHAWKGQIILVHPDVPQEALVLAGGCAQCVKVHTCMDINKVVALALLILDLGAASVQYGRVAQKTDARMVCDEQEGVWELFATHASKPLLVVWLDSILSQHAALCDNAVRPTLAMDKYGSDKGTYGNYATKIYDALLSSQQCSARNVLEVGIGSLSLGVPSNMQAWLAQPHNPTWRGIGGLLRDTVTPGIVYGPGASLRAWLEVFPFANVTGLDVDLEALVRGPRLRSHLCNTLNTTQVRGVLHGAAFDLIVDDGLHTILAQRATLRALWPYLLRGGYYIIEDVDRSEAMYMVRDEFMEAVAVHTGAQTLVLALKGGEELPLQSLTLPYVSAPELLARHEACWDAAPAQHPGPERCCGEGGVFPPPGACFGSLDELAECCGVHFVRGGWTA